MVAVGAVTDGAAADRSGRAGGIGVFPEKIFGNTLAKKPDFGYNKKKATAGKRAGGRN